MSDQFLPLYVTLITGALISGGLAIWLAWRLRDAMLGAGEPHALAEIEIPPPPAREPPSALVPE